VSLTNEPATGRGFLGQCPIFLLASSWKRQFTAVIERRGNWYVRFVQEIPGVNTQGQTLAEIRRNLKHALTLVMETNKELATREGAAEVVREESS
jgi:predicted RNase H-like HicB family nuclease